MTPPTPTHEPGIELLQKLAGRQRIFLGIAEDVIVDGQVYRAIAWSDPCLVCGREITRRTVHRVEPGTPFVIHYIAKKISRSCSGCSRDIWSLGL